MSRTKIFTITGGFYYFGTEIPAPEGYIAVKDAAMFGNFGGNMGLPGVAKGKPGATVTLDLFGPDQQILFPLHAVIAIIDSVDLYTFKGTTKRG